MNFLNKLKLKQIEKKHKINKNEFSIYKLKKIGIERNKDSIIHLFLGSSHGMLGINTNFYKNCTAYNLCIGSQDLYYSYELYKKYADICHNLEYVYLTYSVFSAGYELQKTINSRFAYYYKKVFDINFKYKPHKTFLEKELNFLDKLTNDIYCPKGYTGYQESISPFNYDVAIKDVKSHLKHAFRNNGQENFVKEFAQLAKQKGHKLIVIIPPHSYEYKYYCKKIANDIGVKYTDIFDSLYNQVNDFKILNFFNNNNFNNEDFMDWEHLLPSGCLKLTKIILDEEL